MISANVLCFYNFLTFTSQCHFHHNIYALVYAKFDECSLDFEWTAQTNLDGDSGMGMGL